MLEKDSEGRYCGYVKIDENDKRKQFPKRFVVLDKACGLVKWFNEDPQKLDSVEVCGMINIGYITKVDIASKLKLDHCFVINTPFRPYYAQALSPEEAIEWVEVLNDASKITVPPEALLPKSNEESSPNLSPKDVDKDTYTAQVVGGVVVKKKKLLEVHSARGSDEGLQRSKKFIFSSLHDLNSLDGDIIKAGWAVKQGHIRKNWKRRFFRLSKTGFSYHKTNNDEDALRYISMRDIILAKKDDSNQVRENLLFVVTTDRIYYIQADSAQEMHDWILAFKTAIESYRTAQSAKQGSVSSLDAKDTPESHQLHPVASLVSLNIIEEDGGAKKHRSSRSVDLKFVEDHRNNRRSIVSLNPDFKASKSFFRRSLHSVNKFDPEVDMRSTLKPSVVKKKKNMGAIFSLNNVMNKKAEKMNRQVPKLE